MGDGKADNEQGDVSQNGNESSGGSEGLPDPDPDLSDYCERGEDQSKLNTR